MMLYPLKFKPILKEKIWGGHKLEKLYGKDAGRLPNIGESWEISGYGDDISVVENGFLAGNDLSELVEVYMNELVGDKVYERFGQTFPLLFKLIDANADLSIQVHPDDEIAAERHRSFGKTEMWYVLNADENGCLIAGFKQDSDKIAYKEALEAERVDELLQKIPVKQNDVIFIPAGTIHSICQGVMVAEIQQTSDVTYRIYDYNRKDVHGHTRQLHTEEALDVINFSAHKEPLVKYTPKQNDAVNLAQCPYFTTNLITFNQPVARDYAPLDSFVVYMCIEGNTLIETEGGREPIRKGETILIPACLNDVTLIPDANKEVKLLEVYILND